MYSIDGSMAAAKVCYQTSGRVNHSYHNSEHDIIDNGEDYGMYDSLYRFAWRVLLAKTLPDGSVSRRWYATAPSGSHLTRIKAMDLCRRLIGCQPYDGFVAVYAIRGADFYRLDKKTRQLVKVDVPRGLLWHFLDGNDDCGC